jgi:hypothetical protein
MSTFNERIWTENHTNAVDLYQVPPEAGEVGPMIELTLDNGDTLLTQRLGLDAVHGLLLALQRWERVSRSANTGGS